jgi:hypothetical protein
VDEALTRVEEAVKDCLSVGVYALPPASLVDCLDRVQVLAQRVLSLQLGLVREADARSVAAGEGASSTAVWLRDRWRVTPSTAARMVKLAAVLDARPATAAALAAGMVNGEQATVIGAAVKRLPILHHADGERLLLSHADVLGPRELGRVGERLFEVLDPDQADKLAREAVERDEQRAHHERCFTVTDIPGSARVRVSGWLDREAAAILRTALDPLCAPCPDPDTGARDPRSPAQRRADALAEVCRLALACGQLSDNGGDRPQIVVTIPYTALREPPSPRTLDHSQPLGGAGKSPAANPGTSPGANAGTSRVASGTWRGAAELDDGGRISAATARRLACDAGILPAVLGSQGQVLDLGRQRRLFTGPLRRALVLRDQGCAFPGCDRPARWCDGHHIRHWADGGTTNLGNAVLLCGFHHRTIHHSEWTVHINPADGLPEFLPPPLLDPRQRPRRNTHHHTAGQNSPIHSLGHPDTPPGTTYHRRQ